MRDREDAGSAGPLVKSEDSRTLSLAKSASEAQSSDKVTRQNTGVLLEPGMAARRRQDHAGALAHFKAVAAKHPEIVEIQIQIAITLCKLGRLHDATACCEKVSRQTPGDDRTRYVFGLIARERQDHAGALEHFKAAASLKPHNLIYLLEIVQTLRTLGCFDEARSHCANILEQEPRHARARFLLGDMAWCEKDYPSALSHFEAAAALDPQNRDVRFRIGLALRHLGRLLEAEASLRELLDEDAPDVRVALAMAGILRQKGELSEALQLLESTAKNLPDNNELQLEIGRILLQQHHLDGARSKFRALLQTCPDMAAAHLGLGNVEYHAMEWTAALAHFQEAAALRPDDPKIRVDIALTLAELLRFEEADAMLSDCERDPAMNRDLEYQIKKLNYYCERMEFAKAEPVGAGLLLNRDIPAIALRLVARLYAELGRWNDILDLFRERITVDMLSRSTQPRDLILDAVAAAARCTGRYEDVLEVTDGWSSWDRFTSVANLRDEIIEEARLLESLDLSDRFARTVRQTSIMSPLSRDRGLVQTRLLSAQGRRPATDLLDARHTDRGPPTTATRSTIYYCTDARYFLGTVVSLFTLLSHNPAAGRNCNLIVYCPAEIVETAQQTLGIIASFFGATIDVRNTVGLLPQDVDFRTSWGRFLTGQRLSQAAYYRIYAARRLLHEQGQGRALYIDSDTCVGPGIETLLGSDLGGMPIAARPDLVTLPSIARATFRLDIEKGKYFNSGVLLFDLTHPELEAGLTRSIEASIQKQHLLMCLDQCALNLGFKDLAASLPEHCNFYVRQGDNLGYSPQRPIVTHFLDHPKPWDPRYNSSNCMIWFDDFAALGDLVGGRIAKELLRQHFLAASGYQDRRAVSGRPT
jgi:tetratricopeptide (TPR) repeat protein/lipopolysaccharide biosynthesis glycosyltransferase